MVSLAEWKYSLGPPLVRKAPLLRTPMGGYRTAPTKALASAGLLTMGHMIPSAPASSTFWIIEESLPGTRTSAAVPVPVRAIRHPTMSLKSAMVCCISMTTESYPSFPMDSASVIDDPDNQQSMTISSRLHRSLILLVLTRTSAFSTGRDCQPGAKWRRATVRPYLERRAAKTSPGVATGETLDGPDLAGQGGRLAPSGSRTVRQRPVVSSEGRRSWLGSRRTDPKTTEGAQP